MASAVTWKSKARSLSTRALAEKANVAAQMCTQWTAEVEAADESAPDWYEWLNPVYAGLKQGTANQDKAEAEKVRADWCERRDWYKAELNRRKATDSTVEGVEEEVEEELEEQRAETREKVRKTEEDWQSRGGIVGAPVAAAGDTVLGFFGRIRENALGVFGLGSDQPVGERLVGIARLALAAIGIYVVWLMASRITGGAVSLGERSAGRIQTGLETVKDIKIPGVM